jgi:hypothetical protein
MLWNMTLHLLSVIEGYLLAVYTWPVVQAILGRRKAADPAAESQGQAATWAMAFRSRLETIAASRFMTAVKDWFLRSATILWARLMALAGLLLAALDWLANLAGLPGVSGNIQSLLSPKYVPWYLIAIAIITELARRRTLNTGSARPSFILAGAGSSGENGVEAPPLEAAPGKATAAAGRKSVPVQEAETA